MEVAPEVPPPVAIPAAAACGNCGAELLGPHCFRCGQPTRGLVRHFGSIIGDFFDSVFNLDSRTLQTLGPLFFKPGFLSREYFAGRRVRYVTPVRMFVFLTLIAFFVSNLSLDIETGNELDDDDDIVVFEPGDVDDPAVAGPPPPGKPGAPPKKKKKRQRDRDDDILRATNVEQVAASRDRALAELAAARKEAAGVPGVAVGLDAAETQVRDIAERRIKWIGERDAAIKAGKPVPPEPRVRGRGLQFGDWDPHKTPVALAWLPDFANSALTDWARRAFDNGDRIRDNPRLLAEAFFSVAPQTLFVLLPLFAVLLKILFVFKRRLYMEHMIVALHSHAFIALWLILIIGADALVELVRYGWLQALLNFAIAALWIWLPLYLLLMQKRVYAQGWIMTLLKFFVLGIAYVILLALGASFALVLSLVLM